MRIAHFCDSHPGRPDGVVRSAELHVRLLRAAGHEVDFYRPGPRADGGVRSVPVPFRHVRVGLPFTPRPADLVHTHSTGPIGMTGFRAAAAWNVPLVTTWHTDLLAYADLFAEIPVGAAWCALRLGLGWTPAEYWELTRPGAVRHRRLVELGKAMFARMAVPVAPSAKTAAGCAVFEPPTAVRVLPTPVTPAPERNRAAAGTSAHERDQTTAGTPTPAHHQTTAGTSAHERDQATDVTPTDERHRTAVSGTGPAAGTSTAASAGAGAGGNVVLSVGRATAEKNPELLLRAFARVHAVRPDTRLVMLGVRQRRRHLDRRIAALGLTGHVQVRPPVPHHEVANYYRAAAVLAFASTTDTQSLVLTEAEAAGLPAVVADPDLAVRPDGTVRFTCSPDPHAFARALLRMVDDERLRTRVSGEGLAAVAAYEPKVFVARLLDIYDQARG